MSLPNAHSGQSQRDLLQAKIVSLLPQLSHDELRVFDVQLDRMLRIGRASYAPLDLSKDNRDWSGEIGEELSDALFYLCARHVAREDAKREAAHQRVWHAMVGQDGFGIVTERCELPIPSSTFDVTDGNVNEVLMPHELEGVA